MGAISEKQQQAFDHDGQVYDCETLYEKNNTGFVQ